MIAIVVAMAAFAGSPLAAEDSGDRRANAPTDL